MAGQMMKVFCVIVVCLVVSSTYAEGDDDRKCGDTTTKITPCLNYFRQGGNVPSNCCDGYKRVENISLIHRQHTCWCLKDYIKTNKDAKFENANLLPNKCRVNIPYPRNYTDCFRIK
ncbi:Art v 3 allergen precursor [Artemisia annua]|uniref:Non-specific lipid-transfer protein n=1 Tax=Artemisia annua TaxID=35608 RepID=A0A2U1LNU0_ARTAN|nr:Art v 3 allergen precursor [Artemisia annua]